MQLKQTSFKENCFSFKFTVLYMESYTEEQNSRFAYLK